MLLIDDREPENKIQLLRTALGDHRVKVIRSEVADYFSDDLTLGIERKSTTDYITSLCSNRLFQQAFELQSTFKLPYIFIEGSLDELVRRRRGVSITAIFGSLASLYAHYNVSVLFTGKYFVQMVEKFMLKHFDAKEVDYARIRDIKKPTATLKEKQLYILSSFPNVNTQRAKNLRLHFGSIRKIVNASEVELAKVDNIGKIIAKGIVEVVK